MDSSTSLGGACGQVGALVQGLSTRQRIMLGAGALAVALTLFVFVRFVGKPDMKPLYSGMTATEAQALGSRLAAKNIQYEISADGASVSVPADQLDTSRLEIASQGMPRTGRLGFELFDKPNWGGSDFSEKVNYQRALEGELEHTIQTLNDVEEVRVHLVLPADSIFSEREHESKAAVILKVRGGRLPEQTQQAITRLVASSVDKLRPENVTVVDADSNRPMNTPVTGSGTGMGLDEQLAAHLIKTLEPVVGEQRLRATVKLEYDLSSSEENQETYDPNTSVPLTMQRSEERSGGALASGVPGTSSNVPNATGTKNMPQGDASQSSKTENGTYGVNRVIRHTMNPAGRLKRIATALLVDDAYDQKIENGKRTETRRKRATEEMKQIEELAKAAIGYDAARGDILSVQNIGFQNTLSEAPQPATKLQKVRTYLVEWSSAVRYAVVGLLFLFVYLLILRPVKQQIVLTMKQLPLSSKPAKPLTRAEQPEMLIDNEPTPELQKAAALKRNLVEKVKNDPAATSRLLQNWIREGGTN